MAKLEITAEPSEVGFDPDRLDRVRAHFKDYVDDERLPGYLVAVMRGDHLVYVDSYGQRDVEADLPVEHDTIFRIYSMTKPITSVAAMMLWEQGRFELRDPVHDVIPSFRDTPVYVTGSALAPATEPQRRPMEMWHLLTHTSGLTYDFHNAHPVDQRYRDAGFSWGFPKGLDLEAGVDLLAAQPLLFQPGAEWNYSMSTDVLGRVIEVISGRPLDEFLRESIFEPLGMVDTGFHCPPDDHGRLAALYSPTPGSLTRFRNDGMGAGALSPPTFLAGGGGLVSTAADYLRFMRMLANEGELDGARLLGSRTLRMMTENHLPGDVDLTAFGRPLFAETTFDGVGFGLGFSVVVDPIATRTARSLGEFAWGGAASTAFWIDPAEDIAGLFLTQLLPSSTHPLRTQLVQLVNQALID